MDPDASIPTEPEPSVFSYVLSFLLVGVAWGFTTPFIRRAAADFNARQEKQANASAERGRSRSPRPPQTGFTDAGEEQELLSPVGRDNETEHGDDVRERSTSRSDLNRKPKTGNPNTELDIGNATSSRSLNSLSEDEEEDNLPAPAWRRGPATKHSWLRTKATSIFWTVVNLLRTPAYAIPLVINLTGSIWFFLLVGKHGLFSDMSRYRSITDFSTRIVAHCATYQLECVLIYRYW